MAIRISKKVRTILFIVLGVLVLGGGGYLLWRVNQDDTVAPTDSDASGEGCGVWTLNSTGTSCYRSCTNTYSWVYDETNCDSLCSGTHTYNADISTCTCVTTELSTDLSLCSGGGGGSTPTPTAPSGCRIVGSKYDTESACNSASKSCTDSEQGGCYYDSSTDGFYPTCCTKTTTTKYTLTYSAGTGGSLTGSTSQSVNKGSSGTAVTAVADDGYTFSKWSDNSTSNPRTDTNVQSNISVSAVFVGGTGDAEACEGESWIEKPTGTYEYGTDISARVENTDEDGITLSSISVKLNGDTIPACTTGSTTTCYQTNVVDGDTRIILNLGTSLDSGDYSLSFSWKDGDGNSGCALSTTFTVAEDGEEVIITDNGTVPQTGIFDTVLGRISFGFGFIVMGGLVTQYSKFQTFYNGVVERSEFRKEIRRSKRTTRQDSRRRNKLEKKFR